MTPTPDPARDGDRFTDESGKDWFWTGNHTREQVINEFASVDEAEITQVRGDIEFQSGDVTDHDPYLYVRENGAFVWWQVEGGEY